MRCAPAHALVRWFTRPLKKSTGCPCGDNAQITASNVEKWFNENYTVLSMAEHSYLSQPQRNAALAQVQRYVDCQRGNWEHIKQAEVDVSLVKPDYIIDGKIDLLRGEGDSVYIIDFKAEQKPKTETDARVERYRQQLNIRRLANQKVTMCATCNCTTQAR